MKKTPKVGDFLWRASDKKPVKVKVLQVWHHRGDAITVLGETENGHILDLSPRQLHSTRKGAILARAREHQQEVSYLRNKIRLEEMKISRWMKMLEP